MICIKALCKLCDEYTNHGRLLKHSKNAALAATLIERVLLRSATTCGNSTFYNPEDTILRSFPLES
jgi:hypothetical protein